MENATESFTTVLTHFRKNANENFFSWYDYLLFGIMLSISGGTGIYFGCFGKKQTTASDYLMGGRNMKVIPVVISLIASHTSGITLLAVPSDVYVFGAAYLLSCVSILIMMGITITVFLPVFYDLELTSTYEYLGYRFDGRVRKCSSFFFAMAVFSHIPVIIYIPALAFSAASGINVHLVTPVVCSICIFYTTIGGLKGLVWADTVQFSVTFGAITVLLGLGIEATGGVAAIWNKVVEQGRLDIFDLDINMTKRESFLALVLGLTVHWIAHTSVNQGCTQKFLSVDSFAKSKRVVILYCCGMVVVKFVSVCSGLVLAARYADCDPFITKRIDRNDQLLPFYVLEVAKSIPGLSGLFIAGVFSASLSSLSSNLNSVSGTIYEDFLKEPLAKRGHDKDGLVLKILVVIVGVMSTLLVYVVERLGGLLSISIGLGSMAHGPVLGLFLLGFLFPRANGKGAFWGSMVSWLCMSVVVLGHNYYKSIGRIRFPHKFISVDACDFDFNRTAAEQAINATMSGRGFDVFPLFRISFYFYTMMGAVIGITAGLIISYMTEPNDPRVPKRLLSPVIRPFLPKDWPEDTVDVNYYGVDEAAEKVRRGSVIRKFSELSENDKRDRLRKASYISEVFET